MFITLKETPAKAPQSKQNESLTEEKSRFILLLKKRAR
jgi:hypothetical protein